MALIFNSFILVLQNSSSHSTLNEVKYEKFCLLFRVEGKRAFCVAGKRLVTFDTCLKDLLNLKFDLSEQTMHATPHAQTAPDFPILHDQSNANEIHAHICIKLFIPSKQPYYSNDLVRAGTSARNSASSAYAPNPPSHDPFAFRDISLSESPQSLGPLNCMPETKNVREWKHRISKRIPVSRTRQ